MANTFDERGPRPEWMIASDTLHHATQYLAHSWGVDTSPERFQANLDARLILINCNTKLLDEVERLSMSEAAHA